MLRGNIVVVGLPSGHNLQPPQAMFICPACAAFGHWDHLARNDRGLCGICAQVTHEGALPMVTLPSTDEPRVYATFGSCQFSHVTTIRLHAPDPY